MFTRNALHKAFISTSKSPLRLGTKLKYGSTTATSSATAMTSFPQPSAVGDSRDLTLGRDSVIGGGFKENNDLALGLRSSRPPDSVSPSKVSLGKTPKPDPNEEVELSDAEWEIRTGAFTWYISLELTLICSSE